MHLVRLEMYGFKSFANKTEFNFSPGITAFVGPNGCGKSNVADAIRWVLGEQNPRILRAVKMEDLIYAGSENSQHKNYAEVSIVLDNSDSEIPLDFREVTLTRRYYRSGESEFFLNKVPCRLKDFTEILSSTSLGKGTYAIIGQGQVEEVINSRPEERRLMFEEAAGISFYKLRKREAQKKLSDTQVHLTRIEDIVHELAAQEEDIRESAAKAAEYLQYKEQADVLELALWAGKYLELQKRLEGLNRRRQELNSSRAQHRTSLQAAKGFLAEIMASLQQCQSVIGALEKNKSQLIEDKREQEYKLQLAQQRQVDYAQMVTTTQKLVSRLQAQIKESDMALAALGTTISALGHQAAEYSVALKARNIAAGLVRRLLAAGESYRQRAAAKVLTASVESSDITARLDKARQAQAELAGQMESLGQELAVWEVEAKEAQGAIDRLQSAHSDLESQGKKLCQQLVEITEGLKQKEQERDALAMKRTQLAGSQSVLQQKLEMLTTMTQDFQGFPQGTRSILQASQEGRLRGVLGAVADLIQVKNPGHSLAVETALGGALNYVICSDEETCRRAIELLKKTRGGRVTMVPVTATTSRTVSRSPDYSSQVLGWADELVACAPEVAPVIQMLLGNVLVSENLADATKLAVAINYRYKVVTLEGEVISRGLFTGGSRAQNSQGLLQRKAALTELQTQLEQQGRELVEVDRALSRFNDDSFQELRDNHALLVGKEEENQRELIRIQTQLEQALQRSGQAEERCAVYQDKQSELQAKIHQANLEVAGVNSKIDADKAFLQGSQRLRDELQGIEADLRDTVSVWASRQNSLQLTIYSLQNLEKDRLRQQSSLLAQDSQLRKSLKAAEDEARAKQGDLAALTDDMSAIRTALTELSQGLESVAASLDGQCERHNKYKGQVEATNRDIVNLREELESIQAALHEAELKQARWQTESEAMARELGSQFGLDPETGLTNLDQRYSVNELAAKAKKMRARMEELGEINLAAIGQHKKLAERLEFLSVQKLDLAQAERDILSLVAELDGTIRTCFMETFSQVQEQFTEIFRVLFTGGNAFLSLTDEAEPLETGIEIFARPPGKKTQSLTLLSGGEKSMTAIALLFALQSVRPAPFSVLDEIEAALDEVNILRFATYLRQMAKSMQFIIITHRRETMEHSDSLYGITLGKDGSSQLISVALNTDRQKEQAI